MPRFILNHPYGKPVIGWRHEMEQLSRDDAIGFYRRFYAPNNAVVVIAGDVDPAQARALAEETYGKIPRHGTMAPRMRAQEPPPVAVRSLTLADAASRDADSATGVSGAVVRDGQARRVRSARSARPYSRERLQQPPLSRACVVDKQVAVAADAWYDASALDMSKFAIHGSPRPGVTLPQLEAETDAVIAQVIDKGVTEEELERAKTRLIADAVYAQDNQASMARWYGTALTTGASVNDVRHWPDRIRAVTADQVQDAARQWLDKRRSVTGYLIKDVSPQAEKRS